MTESSTGASSGYGQPDRRPEFFKPDTIDTLTYDKPNAYDDGDAATPHVDADYALNEEYVDDGEEPLNSTVVRYKSRKTRLAPSATSFAQNDADANDSAAVPSTPMPTTPGPAPAPAIDTHESRTPSPTPSEFMTPSLMTPASTTVGSVLPEDIVIHGLSSSSSLLLDSAIISPSTSVSSFQSASSTFGQGKRLESLKQLPPDALIKYDLRKHSLTRPHLHDIYMGGTKTLAFRKLQSHSYSWGFQNILYRPDNDANGKKTMIKVAEVRRRAFQKEMTIEWAMDDHPTDDTNHVSSRSSICSDDSQGSHCDTLENTASNLLLFCYYTTFASKYTIRWRRTSLVSHDIYCLIRPVEVTKGGWQLLAEFDSHGMGYLIHVGQLAINKDTLEKVDQPEHLKAHLLVTCCTLVDLMREVVQKAVGITGGGVAASG
ncbi:hypothetical protein BC940DRAFT_295997 [Gongronella butleri]|nr:hypothetical protein BC940DRAFT_295997 [Gongronella butleri]